MSTPPALPPLIAAVAALGLALAGCPAPQPEPPPDPETELPPLDEALEADLLEAMEASLETYGPPGLQVGVVRDGYAPWSAAVGVADTSTGEALTAGHRLKAGSITKTLVAATVVQLDAEGALSLQDLVGDWYPGPVWADEVTLRQLLMHTSGVPEYGADPAFQANASDVWAASELVDLVADAPLAFTPGTSWSYANTNYVLAGLAIEAATGATWEAEVTARTLEATGLGDSYTPAVGEGWGDIAEGYLGGLLATETIDPSAVGAAGNLVSTAEDLARWATALWRSDVLTPDELETLVGDPFPINAVISYGLATLVIQPDPDEPRELAHNGALNGYVAWCGYREDLGTSIALLANAWPEDGLGGYDYGYSSSLAQDLWAVLEE